MLNDLVLADDVAVIIFQFAENNGGEDRQPAQDEERLVDAVNHFRRAAVKAVGNEERRGQRRRRHAETDGHTRHACIVGSRPHAQRFSRQWNTPRSSPFFGMGTSPRHDRVGIVIIERN